MYLHEEVAISNYDIENSVDTTGWTITTIPAEHVAPFKALVRRYYNSAIERRNEPDDPGDQAYWQERVNEWRDILSTLEKTYA